MSDDKPWTSRGIWKLPSIPTNLQAPTDRQSAAGQAAFRLPSTAGASAQSSLGIGWQSLPLQSQPQYPAGVQTVQAFQPRISQQQQPKVRPQTPKQPAPTSAALPDTTSPAFNDGIRSGDSSNSALFRTGTKLSCHLPGGSLLKRVDELTDVDFVLTAACEPKSLYRVESCRVVNVLEAASEDDEDEWISLRLEVSNEEGSYEIRLASEQPLFVLSSHGGWAALRPEVTLSKYGLACRQLSVGDRVLCLLPKLSSSAHEEAPSVSKKPRVVEEKAADLSKKLT